MAVLSTGAEVLAHGVHYSVLGAGLVGLVVLLAPRFLPGRERLPQDAHAARVLALRRQLQAPGESGLGVTQALTPDLPTDSRSRADGRYRALLPIAVVSSAAAAGVHAAVGPDHFRERTIVGLFFVGSALLQVGWSVAVIALGASTRLLRAAVVGNLGVVGLWAVTRTYGLPFGLLPTRESVGPWDACCVLWEISVAVTCWGVLRSGTHRQPVPGWSAWPAAARSWAIGSAGALVVLALSGATS